MLAEEAPKITDWMQAWGSVAGLVMSTLAVLFTGLLFRHEIRVRREEQRDNEAAQARLVVARPVTVKLDERSGKLTHVGCLISNYSNAPVFNLTASLFHVDERGAVDEESALFSVVQESTAWNPALATPVRDFEGVVEGYYCVISFTDSAGLYWRRSGLDLPTRQFPPRPRLTTRLRVSTAYWSKASLIWLRRLPDYIGYRIRQARSR